MTFLVIGDAYPRDIFKEVLNNKFSGLVRETLKWKTAEQLEGNISSWKTESERLLAELLDLYLDSEVKGSIRSDLKKKRKVWNELGAAWREREPAYRRRAWSELLGKGFPSLQFSQMPSRVVEELITSLTEKVSEFEKYPELTKVLRGGRKKSRKPR